MNAWKGGNYGSQKYFRVFNSTKEPPHRLRTPDNANKYAQRSFDARSSQQHTGIIKQWVKIAFYLWECFRRPSRGTQRQATSISTTFCAAGSSCSSTLVLQLVNLLIKLKIISSNKPSPELFPAKRTARSTQLSFSESLESNDCAFRPLQTVNVQPHMNHCSPILVNRSNVCSSVLRHSTAANTIIFPSNHVRRHFSTYFAVAINGP